MGRHRKQRDPDVTFRNVQVVLLTLSVGLSAYAAIAERMTWH
jgi:hypothetical protein